MEIKQRGSHLDHLVRQTRMHHTQLSSMADMKANMLLTMASVVVTLSVRYIAEPHLKWATIVLIVFCLMTIGLATYAVMPKTPFLVKRETADITKTPGFNILFFADFVRLSYEEFEMAMEEVMNDHSLHTRCRFENFIRSERFWPRRSIFYCGWLTLLLLSAPSPVL
jgi:hypothetical protein